LTGHTRLSIRALRTAALACAILFGFDRAASAQHIFSDTVVSLEATTGFISGGASEFVYDSGYKMSELDWASRPLVYWGLAVNLDSPSGFYTRLALKAGFSGKTGYMTDSDWQNWDGVKTNFSQSDSYTDQAFMLNFTAGYDFQVSDSLTLGPFFELGYLNFEWSARDGFLQYPSEIYPSGVYAPYTPISANTPIVYITGIGIVYQQSCFYPGLGVRAVFRPTDRWRLSAAFVVSPAASMTTTDNHVARSLVFSSSMSGGLVLEPRVAAEYQLSRAMKLGLEVTYLSIQNLTGDLTQTDQYGTSYTDPGGSGASFEALEAGIDLAVRL
jgi:outer membrane protease